MKKFALIFVATLLIGCVAQEVKRDQSAYIAAAPRSILIVPIVNKSLEVDAPDYMLTTLPVTLGEKGYYVFPVNTTKFVLEHEGFYESEKIHGQPTADLAKLFGADAVLYLTINRWDAKYAILSTSVTVEIQYRMVSKDGTEIWQDSRKVVYTPQSGGGHPLAQLIVAAINAAVTRAAPNYMPLAKMANGQALVTGINAPPNGPYYSAPVATPPSQQ